MLRRILTRFLPAIFYVVFLVILLKITGQLQAANFVRIDFLVGLFISIGVGIVIERWPRRFYAYVLGFVIVALFSFGIFLIIFSRNTSFWDNNPPWNPSVLGAGVSITALACAFLFVSWPLFRSQPSGDNTGAPPVSQIDRPSLKNIRDSIGNHQLLMLGLSVTFILLIIFTILQQFVPRAMQLEVKWIVVACIPLVIALIAGGYIRVIKGFGVELETRIKSPIASLDLEAQEVLVSLEGIRKGTLAELDRISPERKRGITRLQFFVRRQGYYDLEVLQIYLSALPNLEYFEMVKPTGLFVCLLPVRMFYYNDEVDLEELEHFLNVLVRDKVSDTYRSDAITATVRAEQSIATVLEILRSSRLDAAVVLDSKGAMLGLIKTSDIEKRIADEVIFEAKRKKES